MLAARRANAADETRRQSGQSCLLGHQKSIAQVTNVILLFLSIFDQAIYKLSKVKLLKLF